MWESARWGAKRQLPICGFIRSWQFRVLPITEISANEAPAQQLSAMLPGKLAPAETFEVLGSSAIGAPQGDPPGHVINRDHKGNIYAVQAGLSVPERHGGAGAQKFMF